MKKRLGLTALALLTIVGIVGVTGCSSSETPTSSDDTPVSSVDTPDESSTSVEAKVARVVAQNPKDTIVVGEDVDLADYVTVHYSDGTTDHNIVVTAATGFSVEGTVVTINKVGTYNIKVAAAKDTSKTARVEVVAATADRLAFNDLFNSISNNYIAENVSIDFDAGKVSMSGGWTRHNETYADYYYYDGKIEGVTAKLSNGNYYNGDLSDVKGIDDFTVKYEPGKVTNWSNLYMSQSLNDWFSAETAFESQFEVDEETGEEVEYFVMGEEYAEDFCTFTCLLGYGDVLDFTMTVLDWSEGDEEKGKSSYILYAYTWSEYEEEPVYDESSSVVSTNSELKSYADYWLITDIDTASSSVIEASQKDASYLPPEIDVSELTTRLESINTSKNYTLQIEPSFLDSTGKTADATKVAGWSYSSLFPYERLVVTENSAAFYEVSGSNWVLSYGFTTYNDKVYYYSTDKDGNKNIQETTITNLWTDRSSLLSFNVSGISDLNFSNRTETDKYTYWSSDAGENDGTTDTTKFTRSLFTKYTNSQISLGEDHVGFANVMCDAIESDAGSTFSASVNGKFSYYLTDTALQISYRWALGTFGINSGTDIYYLYLTSILSSVGTSVEPDVSAWTSQLSSGSTSTSAE